MVVGCVVPFIGAVLVMVHHRLKHGYWFDWEDINNHETIALFLIGLGIGMLLG